MNAAKDAVAKIKILALALALVASAGGLKTASAQGFPKIPVWAYPGAYQAGPDSIREQPRTVTLRWMRDPDAEARPDFAGYRIYRVFHSPDTARMELVRRFSKQASDALLMWHFPDITGATPDAQRIATFVDPDSSGSFFKRCRRDTNGVCFSQGDSILVLIPPPGPHDGFRTWYSITYEGQNVTGNDYLDLFLPDTVGCPFADRDSCPNLNHKALNLTAVAVEPTSGPTGNLQTVAVVPNPFRAREVWDQPGSNEIHFVNLPTQAKISIYTIAGDLVVELQHNDPVRDFERWDLKNARGQPVASGIYMFRVESGSFFLQNRFVVIR